MVTKAEQRAWLERDYPRKFHCGFCDSEVTVSLRAKDVTTVTRGHKKGCVMA